MVTRAAGAIENTRTDLLPLTVLASDPGPARVISLSMVNVAVVRAMVPLRPAWKFTMPPAGVVAMASRSEPGSWSVRLVTVLGTQRASKSSRCSQLRRQSTSLAEADLLGQ